MLKNLSLSKKVSGVLLIVGLTLLAVAGVKGLLGSKKTSSTIKTPQDLIKSVASTLPKEGQDRMFVNPDKQSKGMSYLSSVFMSEEVDKAPKYVSDFVYKSVQKIQEEDLDDVSAVTIAIYIKSQKKQFRVILGKEIAKQKDSDFWKKEDQEALFKWLTETCPRTNPAVLANFCDISDSLRVQVAAGP